MINQKDLRDIAAYWGCRVTAERIELPWDCYSRTVDGAILSALATGRSEEFKLCLRPISKLTDEEAYACYHLAFSEDIIGLEVYDINRDEDKIEVYAYPKSDSIERTDLSIFSNGHMAATGYRRGLKGIFSPIWDVVSVLAYLRSIYIYIPGSIDPKYVQLIED